MITQLDDVDADSNSFTESKFTSTIFNVRFKKEDLLINDTAIELPRTHPVHELSRYNFEHYRPDFEVGFVEPTETESKKGFELHKSKKIDLNNEDFSSKTYDREPRQVEIEYLHKEISFKLTKILQDRYGDVVGRENPALNKHNRIDIVLQDGDTMIFYEIKTYGSIKLCIREALGQLMEYSYFPDNVAAQKLIIIAPHEAGEDIKRYFVHLRNITKLPIYYQQFDNSSEDGILMEEV